MATNNGYLDLQLNGYDGVDFNADTLDPDEVARVCARLIDEGTSGVLATVITAEIDVMCRRLQNICKVCRENQDVAKVIWGLHIEGPFLNEQPGYIGAHPPDAARPAEPDSMQRLMDAGEGLTRIVTLAPERDEQFRVTRMLADQGVCVSAGHCNPSLDQLQAAIDAGLQMFTHLGNGCPMDLNRNDNVIQRVLSLSDQLWIGLIADGVHVPMFALGNYLAITGMQRAFVVTDAIEAAGRGPGRFRVGQRSVVVDENLATWAEDRSHLVGSALTMPAMVERLRDRLNLNEAEISRLTKINPRAAVGLLTLGDDGKGRIQQASSNSV